MPSCLYSTGTPDLVQSAGGQALLLSADEQDPLDHYLLRASSMLRVSPTHTTSSLISRPTYT